MPATPGYPLVQATVSESASRGSTTQSGSVTGSQLHQRIVETLRRSLIGKYFASLDAERALRADLRVICGDARQQNMRVEYLIIAFKDAWRALPEARTLPKGAQGPEFLNHVITLSIAEYYAADRAD